MRTDAKSGVMTACLITSNPGIEGPFTVGDWIHVWNNGNDYKDSTRLQLGKLYEPEIIIDDVKKTKLPALRSSLRRLECHRS